MTAATFLASPLVRRALRFGVTGIGVTALHVVIAASLINMMALRPALANGAAFIVATLTSYLINTFWSFSQTPAPTNLVRFIIVSLLGLGIAMAVSGTAEAWGFPYWVGIAAVVLTVPPTTFLLHAFWTYRS